MRPGSHRTANLLYVTYDVCVARRRDLQRYVQRHSKLYMALVGLSWPGGTTQPVLHDGQKLA